MRGRLWLGVGVSVVLLWFAFRGVHADAILQNLRQVRTVWLVPVLLSIFVRFWLTALRWQVLLRPTKRIGLHRLFGVTMIGFMANNVLPFRIGEFVRAYALGRSESLAVPLCFATIVVERIFDGFTLLLFLVGGLSFLHPASWLVWSAAATFVLYSGVLVALLTLRGGRSAGVVGWALTWLPGRFRAPATRFVESFRLGLGVLGSARAVLVIAALSLLIWVVNAAGVQAMFAAFSLDLPPHAAFLLLATIAVALVAPAAPGYVGTFQLGTVAGLALYGVPRDTAGALSIVYHAVHYVPITVTGLIYLGSLNLTLGELRAAGQTAS